MKSQDHAWFDPNGACGRSREADTPNGSGAILDMRPKLGKGLCRLLLVMPWRQKSDQYQQQDRRQNEHYGRRQ